MLYTVDGQWTDKFSIKEGKTKKEVRCAALTSMTLGTIIANGWPQIEVYNAKTTTTTPLFIAPAEEQDPLESRRAWQKVQEAISKGDLDTTGLEKTKIENEQREIRKKEKEEGREWERRYFTRVDEDAVFTSLAARGGFAAEADKTNGVWVFDEEKCSKAEAARGEKTAA